MLETEYYAKEYLKPEDQNTVDEIEAMRADVLSDATLDEFLEKTKGGELTKALIREQLAPFVEFLKDRIDFGIVDFIIAKIDDYPDEEYEKLKREADERKRLQQAIGAEA